MKVLHINCNYVNTTLHQTMIEHLDMFNVENQVFVPVYDRNRAVIKSNDNVAVEVCFRKYDRVCFDYKQWKILKRIKSTYQVEDFDIIHAYTVFTDGNCARKLSIQYGIPYVVAVRNTDVNTFFKKMVHLRKRGIQILCDASAIFFLSETYRDLVYNHYMTEKMKEECLKKTYVMPNGIDDFWHENLVELDVVSQNKFLDKHIKLVYAGAINKNKNVLATLKAIKILEGQGYHVQFTVVGKIADQNVFKEMMKTGNVNYIAAKPKEQLLEIYRQNDIFVMPSIHETFGLVYAEAMSQGLPVIYTRGQGFDKQFLDGEVGYPVNCHEPQDIANVVLKIIKEYLGIRQRCVLKTEKFEWNKICRTYNQIYQSLL